MTGVFPSPRYIHAFIIIAYRVQHPAFSIQHSHWSSNSTVFAGSRYCAFGDTGKRHITYFFRLSKAPSTCEQGDLSSC